MKKFEKKVRKYLEERGWDNLRPADLAKSIMIEGAELLELFQWDSPTIEKIKKDRQKLQEIKNELADVMIYCFDLAVVLNVDVEKTLNEKLEKIKQKYPKDVFSKEKYRDNLVGTKEKYWEIKRNHRRK